MENATKALLIAAAILIVILLIAFGMKIFNSTSDTSEQAQAIGKGISEQTGQASTSAIKSITGATSASTDGVISEEIIADAKQTYANNGENNSISDVENFLNSIKNKTNKDNLPISYGFTYTGGTTSTQNFSSISQALQTVKNSPSDSKFSVTVNNNKVSISGKTDYLKNLSNEIYNYSVLRHGAYPKGCINLTEFNKLVESIKNYNKLSNNKITFNGQTSDSGIDNEVTKIRQREEDLKYISTIFYKVTATKNNTTGLVKSVSSYACTPLAKP